MKMPPESENRHSLIPLPDGSLVNTAAGAQSRILGEMIESSLVLARDSAVAPIGLDALVREGKLLYREHNEDAFVREGRRLFRADVMTEADIQAFTLFHRAAVAGHMEAQYLVFRCYQWGRGVQKDYEKSRVWLKKSADLGFAEAQYLLGNGCAAGLDAPADFSEAAKWYRKAAEQGHVDAQYKIGCYYRSGHVFKKDYTEAAKWFRKAAEQGNAFAQLNLGICYFTGEGVPKDHQQAFKWFKLASDQGNEEALKKAVLLAALIAPSAREGADAVELLYREFKEKQSAKK